MKSHSLLLCVGLAACLVSGITPVYAQSTTGPALTISVKLLSSTTPDSITFYAGGGVAYTGTCDASSCGATSIEPFNPTSGVLAWDGGYIDGIAFDGATVTSHRGIQSPVLDLQFGILPTDILATVSVTVTDNGFTVGATPSTMQLLSGTGGNNATYTSYYDVANQLFAHASQIASIGDVLQTVTGPGPATAPFALTSVATITTPLAKYSTPDLTLQLNPISTLGRIGHLVWNDSNHSGGPTQDNGEIGIGGWTVSLTTPGGQILTTTTDTHTGTLGEYHFDGLPSGTYTVCVPAQTAGFFETYQYGGASAGNCSTVNLAVGQDFEDANFSFAQTGQQTSLSLTCPPGTATVGQPYSAVLSASGGIAPYSYSLNSGALPLGLSITPVTSNNVTTWYLAGVPQAAGSFNFTLKVTDHNNTSAICPAPSGNCTIVSSGTLPPIGSGDAATIGFWHNKNGQALIDLPSSTSKALGNWLAANYGALYSGLANKTNAQVAAQFNTYFTCCSPKTQAQVMAVALAAYFTSVPTYCTANSLSNCSTTPASKYGFKLSFGGTATKTYNVGAYGTLIGLPSNNVAYSVGQILTAANSLPQPWSSAVNNALNIIFNGINTTGDIQ